VDVTLDPSVWPGLRGVGDAYHDYRGELQYFTLETKIAILARPWTRRLDDAAALAEQTRAAWESERWRAAPALDRRLQRRSHRRRPQISPPWIFGATLIWTVRLESSEQRTGTHSHGRLCRAVRGEVGGSLIHPAPLRAAARAASGRHELEMRIGRGAPSRCTLVILALPLLRASAVSRGAKALGCVRAALYRAVAARIWASAISAT